MDFIPEAVVTVGSVWIHTAGTVVEGRRGQPMLDMRSGSPGRLHCTGEPLRLGP